MEDEEDLATAYQAAVARNNEMRRQLNGILRNRHRVAHAKQLRLQTIVARLRYKIDQHSELIAELEASIIAEGGSVIPQTLTMADACKLHSLTRT